MQLFFMEKEFKKKPTQKSRLLCYHAELAIS
jgi:hypothetical protein